jgi:hypothetical protein
MAVRRFAADATLVSLLQCNIYSCVSVIIVSKLELRDVREIYRWRLLVANVDPFRDPEP